MTALLVGNYENDAQESMRRFADVLASQLPARGFRVERIRPEPIFGRLVKGATGVGKWLSYLDKFALFPSRLRRRVRQLGQNAVVHICDHSNSIYTRYLFSVPHLVTCHDLLAVRSARGEFAGCRVRGTGRAYQSLILRSLERAWRVACVSSATRRDVLRLTSLEASQVSTVYNGLNHPYGPISPSRLKSRLQSIARRQPGAVAGKINERFVLHVGGNHWYKNRGGVLRIFGRLRETTPDCPRLVMVGQPFTPLMRGLLEELHLTEHVAELTAISNDDLRALYCGAEALLFPSLEEGFGWPIVEAQACGCRVVVAGREPMSEIGGASAVRFLVRPNKGANAGLVFSEETVNAAAEALRETLFEAPEEKEGRIRDGKSNAARFSTAQMVDGYADLYRGLIGGLPGRLPCEARETALNANVR